MRVGGRFNGSGAALYLCIGFVPDFVTLWNVELDTPCYLTWNINMVDVLSNEGIFRDEDGGALENYAKGEGITQYFGGDMLTSTTAGTVTYGNGVYLTWDDTDYKTSTTYGTIDTWTLGHATNFTGNWNLECDTTYVGEGSKVRIDGRWYTITALTSNGEAANEVTLSHSVPSGDIQCIKGMFNTKPMIAADVTPAGFKLSSTGAINTDGEIVAFEAGTYSGH